MRRKSRKTSECVPQAEPSGRPDRLWGSHGIGAGCVTCRRPTTRDQIEVAIRAQWVPLRIGQVPFPISHALRRGSSSAPRLRATQPSYQPVRREHAPPGSLSSPIEPSSVGCAYSQRLAALKFKDKAPAHYEERHFISLELGGHPRDSKNLWLEMWGTPGTPLTSRGPFPSHLVGAKTKDRVKDALHKAVCDGTLTLQEAHRSS